MEIMVATAIIAGLLTSPLIQLAGSSLTPYNSDNMTVSGVLATDSYVLYPYAANSLTWGFSKYGELINGANLTGLSYDGIDVFCNPNVLEKDWSQGWYMDITYADLNNNYQHVWAYALFANEAGTAGIGGVWQEAQTTPLSGVGGRETNVWATTDPITVLYDGPREFIAQCRTTLYAMPDHNVANSGLVNITLTFVFDKDKKQIVEYKDIKRLDQGKFGRDFQVEFGDRGEWDIGTTSAPPSYATIYANQTTVYDYNYQPYYSAANPITGYDVAQIINQAGTYVGYVAYWPQPFGAVVMPTDYITRTQVLSSLCTVEKSLTWAQIGETSGTTYYISFADNLWLTSDAYPVGGGTWSNEPMIFKNGVLLSSPVDYTWNSVTDTITLTAKPLSTDVFTISYMHHQPNIPTPPNNGYEIQDTMGNWAAIPATPYVSGEWVFKLTRDPIAQQFRGVCVYGLTDEHDGDDLAAKGNTWSSGVDVIDSEVQYMLNQVFNPMDLYNAVFKKTAEWVQYYNVTAEDYAAALVGSNLIIPLTNEPVWYVPNWGGYNDKSERVLFNGVLQYPERQIDTSGYDYSYELYVAVGVGAITIFNSSVPVAGTMVKIIYATRIGIDSAFGGRYEYGIVGRNAFSVDSAGLSLVSSAFTWNSPYIAYGWAGEDMMDPLTAAQMPFVMSPVTAGSAWTNYYYSGTDFRTGLKDDYCSAGMAHSYTAPNQISDANLIGVGGPLANMLSYYSNDFATAFFGLNTATQQFTPYAKWQNAIVPLSCWNATHEGYTDTDTTGYAVVSVSTDLNGTVVLSVWGNWGRDTYYVSRWFAEDGIFEFQNLQFKGVTSVVVKITYESTTEGYKPTAFSVPEVLGTISERGIYLNSVLIKGGIHEDP
jgi:hypothetical protein